MCRVDHTVREPPTARTFAGLQTKLCTQTQTVNMHEIALCANFSNCWCHNSPVQAVLIQAKIATCPTTQKISGFFYLLPQRFLKKNDALKNSSDSTFFIKNSRALLHVAALAWLAATPGGPCAMKIKAAHWFLNETIFGSVCFFK